MLCAVLEVLKVCRTVLIGCSERIRRPQRTYTQGNKTLEPSYGAPEMIPRAGNQLLSLLHLFVNESLTRRNRWNPSMLQRNPNAVGTIWGGITKPWRFTAGTPGEGELHNAMQEVMLIKCYSSLVGCGELCIFAAQTAATDVPHLGSEIHHAELFSRAKGSDNCAVREANTPGSSQSAK
jgi:hypothetical protein